MRDLAPPSITAVHNHRRERFTILSNMCRFALIEARRLVLAGGAPSPLPQLVVTAEGLLDDLDGLLLALDPMRHAYAFEQAATLHRALDDLAILRREVLTVSARTKSLPTGDRPSQPAKRRSPLPRS